ncbi:hypothetical protein U1Q18_052256 [Sarracenia purpurea var. burkii]
MMEYIEESHRILLEGKRLSRRVNNFHDFFDAEDRRFERKKSATFSRTISNVMTPSEDDCVHRGELPIIGRKRLSRRVKIPMIFSMLKIVD